MGRHGIDGIFGNGKDGWDDGQAHNQTDNERVSLIVIQPHDVSKPRSAVAVKKSVFEPRPCRKSGVNRQQNQRDDDHAVPAAKGTGPVIRQH